MKKWFLFLSLTLILSVTACAFFMGTARIQVKGVSNQNTALSTLSAQNLAVQIAPGEIAFSPDVFSVIIKKVEVVQGVNNPNWEVVFENGTSAQDIVQGVTLTTSGAELELVGGEYNGVAITYNPQWVASITLSSNDLVFISNDIIYTETNNTTNTTQVIYWATESLKQELIQMGKSVDNINTLSLPLVVNGSLEYMTLNLIFNTKNMVHVWTNSNGSYSNHQFIAPGLAINLQ